jgi:hypothetical protein
MAQKIDEATNIAFVQLIEQEPGLYDKPSTLCLDGQSGFDVGKDFT